jgi:hypothetical protein
VSSDDSASRVRPSCAAALERIIVTTGRARRRDPARDGVRAGRRDETANGRNCRPVVRAQTIVTAGTEAVATRFRWCPPQAEQLLSAPNAAPLEHSLAQKWLG